MKRFVLFIIIAGAIFSNVSAFAELTVDDLEKIQQLIDKFEERIDKRFTELEKRFTSEIQAVEKQLSLKIKGLDERIIEQGKRLDYLGALMIALIIAIIGFVAVPMGLITY